MTEKEKQIRVIFRLCLIATFASLYSWGGIEMKWLRRFLAPSILCAGSFMLSKDWRSLVSLPFMMASLSLGYGADELTLKILKRGIYGLANGMATSITNALDKKWLLVTIQVVLVTLASIVLGAFNILPSARAEEAAIGLVIATLSVLSVKDYDPDTKET